MAPRVEGNPRRLSCERFPPISNSSSPCSSRTIRNARSRYCGSMYCSQRSGGSRMCPSASTAPSKASCCVSCMGFGMRFPRIRCGRGPASLRARLGRASSSVLPEGRPLAQTPAVTIKGKAHIAGAYEHPLREIPDRTVAEIHAEVAAGALADAGLGFDDVDGYFCDGGAPGFGPLSMAEYMGLNRLSYFDTTEIGGSSYIAHLGHAASAIAVGKCRVALITLAGNPRSGGAAP